MTSVPGNDIEVGEDDDDEDPAGTGFVNASQVKPRHIEKMDKSVRIFNSVHRLHNYADHGSVVHEEKTGGACITWRVDTHQLPAEIGE
jgi:hypothetical protein